MKKILLLAALCSTLSAYSDIRKHEIIVNGNAKEMIEIGGTWSKEKEALLGKDGYVITQNLVGGKEFTVEARLALDLIGLSNASFLFHDNCFNFDGEIDDQGGAVMHLSGSLTENTCLIAKTCDWIQTNTPFNFKIVAKEDTIRFFINEKQVCSHANTLTEPGRIGFSSGKNGIRIYGLELNGLLEKGATVQHLFKSGMENYHTFRIPAMEVSNEGTILAFTDARVGAAHDAGDIDIVLKRSEDGGKTWGEMILVFDEGRNTAGNVTPVVDRHTGTIFVFSTWNLGDDRERQIVQGSSKDTRRIFVTQSTDDGLTWSPAKEITQDVKRSDWTWYATGPCHGIQIQQGKYKGRLVIPCDHIERDSKKYYSHAIYSDNHGQSWQLGGRTPVDKVNECTVAELEGGKLILNMRSYDSNVRARKTSISDDGGLTWSELRTDSTLVEPICQASMHRYSFAAEGKNRLLFLNPANSEMRSNLTIRLSDDDGRSWTKSKVICKGPAAYSDVIRLPNGNIACLYEAGYLHPYEGIVYCEIPLSELDND